MKLLHAFMLAAGFGLLSSSGFAQDSVKLVILSPRIGASIDRHERDYFHLMSRFSDFDSAVFYRSSAHHYYAQIALRKGSRVAIDTVVEYSEAILLRMSEIIDHYEDIVAHKYKMGDAPAIILAQLDVAGRSPDTIIVVPDRWKGMYPFAADAEKYFLDDFPDWGFGLSIGFYNADLSSVTAAFTASEDRYRQLGYAIKQNEISTAMGPLILVHCKIRLSTSYEILLEAGRTNGNNISVEELAGSFLYRFEPITGSRVYPIVGGGLIAQHLSAEQKYENRISRIDTVATYTLNFLELQSISAAATKIGITLTGGLDIDMQNSATLAPYVTVNYFPVAKTSISTGQQFTLHLNSVTAGVRLSLYF